MKNIKQISALGTLFGLLAGCSSSSSPVVPANAPIAPSGSPVTSSNGKTSAAFVFVIPSSSTVQMQSISTKHLPSTSSSIAVRVLYASNATTGTAGTVAGNVNIDATTCPVALGAKTCTVSVPLKADSYTVDITTYDAPGQTGNILSNVLALPFTLTDGIVNSIPVTLIGVPKSIVILPDTSKAVSNHIKKQTVGSTYELSGSSDVPLAIFGVDADGNVILTGKPTFTNVTASSSNPAIISTGTTLNSVFPITTQALSLTPVTLSANATYNGVALSTTIAVVPVEELFVGGGVYIDGYAMFSSGMVYLDSKSFPSGAALIIRADSAKKNIKILDNTSGTFYTLAAGANTNPITNFTVTSAIGAQDFAIAPNGLSYYFSNRNNNAVYNVSSSSASILNTYSVSQPVQLDFDATGRLLVAQINFNGTISVLPSGGTAFSTYITGLYYPADLRIGNAANGYLYESNDNGSGQVNIYPNGSATLSTTGTQASSFAFNNAGETFMLNGYINPSVLNVYAPNSITPKTGRSFTFVAGRATGTMGFTI